MKKLSASLLATAYEMSQLPVDSGREIAVMGRSNAGKSTLLNLLLSNNKLLRISNTPGCTKSINFIMVGNNPDNKLVDFPGFGYAKTSKKNRKTWLANASEYLESRRALQAVLYVIDIRQYENNFDNDALGVFQDIAVPIVVVLSKADKVSNNQKNMIVKKFQYRHPLEIITVTSQKPSTLAPIFDIIHLYHQNAE